VFRNLWKKVPLAARIFLTAWMLLWLIQTVPLWVPRWITPPLRKPDQRVQLETTAYCHCGTCCSYTDVLGVIPLQKRGASWKFKRVGLTASGKLAHYGTIAADPAVYPFGTIMKVPGYGYGVVLDTGGDIKGNRIDLYYPAHKLAQLRGRKNVRVKVWLPSE
jgi:3D (Asp-Asp-Asp) domain-containing protein